jgi:hypothetical protein
MAARSRPWTFVCDWGTDEQSGSGCSQGTFLNQALFALDITLGGQAGSKFGPRKSRVAQHAATNDSHSDFFLTHVVCQSDVPFDLPTLDRRKMPLFRQNSPF